MTERFKQLDIRHERLRLEREVVEAGKAFVKEDSAKWDRLVSYKNLFTAVQNLLTFEAEQEKKKS